MKWIFSLEVRTEVHAGKEEDCSNATAAGIIAVLALKFLPQRCLLNPKDNDFSKEATIVKDVKVCTPYVFWTDVVHRCTKPSARRPKQQPEIKNAEVARAGPLHCCYQQGQSI